jgi:hypothetical protein
MQEVFMSNFSQAQCLPKTIMILAGSHVNNNNYEK